MPAASDAILSQDKTEPPGGKIAADSYPAEVASIVGSARAAALAGRGLSEHQ
jgi:hypothetical protein